MTASRHPASRIWLGVALLLAVLTLVQGCSLYPKLDVNDLSDATGSVETHPVPFFPQTDFQCGPAALAGVIGAAGVDITPEDLNPQVYLPERQGSLQVELIAATRRAGLLPYVLDEVPEALIGEIEAGRPVLVFQNLRTRHFPVWHFSVLRGFDAGNNDFIFNSGAREGVTMNARTFLRTWNWANRWALVALTPGTMPFAPDPDRYMESVAVFESVAGVARAIPAWKSAVAHWPSDPRPHLALGNAAYGSGDRKGAVRYYRQGLLLDPAHPALNNNLAAVLGEMGCPRAGERLLGPVMSALPEASNWKAPMTQTLEELANSPGPDGANCHGP